MYVLEVGHSRSIRNSSDIGNVFFRYKLWTLDKLLQDKEPVNFGQGEKKR